MKTPSLQKQSIAIVGGGVAGIMFAAHLDNKLFDVAIYEKGKALGRKFLVAGDGGLNLTHSEQLEDFLKRYTPAGHVTNAVKSFTNADLREWLFSIGIETYVGSSKRVFPLKDIKPITVLNTLLNELEKNRVTIHYQHTWMGWKRNKLLFEVNNELISVKSDIVVFAMGGGSWQVTGSDGKWLELFTKKGIATIPFAASNCAFQVNWPTEFLQRMEGQALKNISVSCEDSIKLGELVITKFGLEGGAVYAVSPQIRQQLNAKGKATIFLDLKPSLSIAEIENKLLSNSQKNLTGKLESMLNLSKLQITLLKQFVGKEDFIQPKILSNYIKHLPIEIIGLAPLDEAISTVGGISLEEIDEHFELKKLKNHYVIGEMLDWDAPTGGYLLQACFSMGVYLAHYFNQKATNND